ncbi:hypothetical protein CYLTODRAFT_488150 [Cylindrobasidium torrendii FP15055 ss-10]|uniref:Uncharacterized protein n=1 Tax=Cylindrobasidium torrendii FP15055 ss-10 TaxID=1314674 RepID=A0A0D7BJR2_9AGAR|nr:hypothetical protein CYLTODRAFT_488150 [Cylindrobasidium torrendii FP15055 ss-10]
MSVTSYTTTTDMGPSDIIAGDVVQVNNGLSRKEGIVVGNHYDYLGRQIVEVQLDTHEVYNAWYPTVTRVRRTVSYPKAPVAIAPPPSVRRATTVERRVIW